MRETITNVTGTRERERERIMNDLSIKEKEKDHHLKWLMITIIILVFLLAVNVVIISALFISKMWGADREEKAEKKLYNKIFIGGGIIVTIFFLATLFCLVRWLKSRAEWQELRDKDSE